VLIIAAVSSSRSGLRPQSSWQIDSQTIEIFRNCGAGAWTKFLRRTLPKNELILEISEQRADGRRFDRRLLFDKQ
jgi:hypothetical protein